jgi:type IV secretion system protein VirB9
MRITFLVLAPLALLGSVARAQSVADNVAGDLRFRRVDYEAGGIVQLPTSPGTVQTVLFEQGEIIRSVILSNPRAYTVVVAEKGDNLTLRPNGPSAIAMMSVRTDARSYEIELTAGSGSDAPSVVRFFYNAVPANQGNVDVAAMARRRPYHLSGSVALRPTSISDDGLKTYISWKPDQPLPAVFAISASGKEEMVDGYVRGGVFTIDRILEKLVFRMDDARAAARRGKERN